MLNLLPKSGRCCTTISSQNMPSRRNRWNLQFRNSIQTVFFNHPFSTQKSTNKTPWKIASRTVPKKSIGSFQHSFSVAAPQVPPILCQSFVRAICIGPNKIFGSWGIYFFEVPLPGSYLHSLKSRHFWTIFEPFEMILAKPVK